MTKSDRDLRSVISFLRVESRRNRSPIAACRITRNNGLRTHNRNESFNPSVSDQGSRHCTRSPDRGFTLLETLVALGLSGILMAAISLSLNLYWKHRSLSYQRLTSAQMLRGLFEDIAMDLRATIPVSEFIPTEAAGGHPTRSTLFRPEETHQQDRRMERFLDIREQFLNPPESIPPSPVHLIGRPDSLAILKRNRNPRFSVTDTAGLSTAGSSDSADHHVIWWCRSRSGHSAVIPLSAPGTHQFIPEISADRGLTGVMRSEIRFPGDSSKIAGITDFPSTTRLITDSVEAVRFRYSDGRKWFDQWDSTRQRSLPKAVEFRFLRRDGTDADIPVIIDLPQSG